MAVLMAAYFVMVFFLEKGLHYLFTPIWGDMWLYTDEARSIAYTGTIKFANMYGVNTAYLYPAVLSVIYKFFYDPLTITYLTRLVGVWLMPSVIFPAFLLGKRMGFGRKKAVILAITAALIPDMMQSFVMVTEVIAYPLFMWALYVFYLDVENNGKYRTTVLFALLCFLNYITRSQNILMAVSYIVLLLFWAWKSRTDRDVLKRYAHKTVIFAAVFFSLYYLIPRLFDFLGIMHYSKSMESDLAGDLAGNMLQRPLYYFLELVLGNVWYFFFILLGFGFFTVIVPLFYDGYEEQDKKLGALLHLITFLTVELVVVSIFFQEEKIEDDTYRAQLRYFMNLFVPYYMLFCKADPGKFRWKKICSAVSGIWAACMIFGQFIFRQEYNPFIGVEAIPLTIYRRANNFVTDNPSWKIWFEILSGLVLLLIVLLIRKVRLPVFLKRIFPCFITVVMLLNTIMYIDRAREVTTLGQGDYVGRYTPVTGFLNTLEPGEAVALISNLRKEDNEIQTLMLFPVNSIDCISFDEIRRLRLQSEGKIDIQNFLRTGYLYVRGTDSPRKLNRAEYFVLYKYYGTKGFQFSNEIVYEDEWFSVYKLDHGILYAR